MEKVLGIDNIVVTDFRKEKVNVYDTIYEVSFMALPIIEANEVIKTGNPQRFYLIYNHYVSHGESIDFIISDLSMIDTNKESEYFWEENTNNYIFSDKEMVCLFDKILFKLKVFNDSVPMFEEMSCFIDNLHEDYIYNSMLDGDNYYDFLLDAFMEESDNAKEQ